MRRQVAFWLVATLAVLACGWGQAAYLESDEPGPAPVIVPPEPPPPPPPPAPDNPLTELVRHRLSVRHPYEYKGLTVHLIYLSEVADDASYLSVQDALRKGVLTVEEKRRATVPALVVRNTGKEPILMLGGEILPGGKQNRILRRDVLLPENSGPVEVPVLCVEQGRWSSRPIEFERHRSVAPLAVRGSALAGRSQDEVWEGVRRYQESLEVESATGDLQAVQDSAGVKEALADYRAQFAEHCWQPEAVGMVVARHGRIVGADIFCNAELFRKHRDRLLESYAVDCLAHPSRDSVRGRPGHLPSAEQFLRRLLRAEYRWSDGPGLGRILSAEGAGVNASALVWRRNVLHASVFAEDQIIIVRPPHPGPRPIPLRRE